MVNVNIKFNNKNYLLSCDKGQEENLKKLANHLDSKYSELKKNLGKKRQRKEREKYQFYFLKSKHSV